MLVLNIIGVLFLILSYISPFVSPAKSWLMAFIGLSYPFILILNFGFILYWILRLRYHFLISLIAILLGYNQFGNLFQFNTNVRKLPENETLIKVLSYNVRVFDLYNYGPNWEHRFTNRNHIFDFLKENDFDIIMFQEYVHDKTGAFKTQDTLKTFLKAKNYHAEFTRNSRNINFFGLATFTKYPIINKGKILFSTHGGNLCIYTDVLINTDTVRIYNIHMESIGLGAEDHIFVENMINIVPADNEDFRIASRRILSRMKVAFGRRALQAEKLAAHIAECPYPIILGGDFNDTPSSYVYRQFSRLLYDSFTKKGRGVGQTYVGMMPGFRIDYIMHSKNFETLQFHTGKEEYSDHYPIWAVMKKKD